MFQKRLDLLDAVFADEVHRAHRALAADANVRYSLLASASIAPVPSRLPGAAARN